MDLAQITEVPTEAPGANGVDPGSEDEWIVPPEELTWGPRIGCFFLNFQKKLVEILNLL